jgi:hypothetical protein
MTAALTASRTAPPLPSSGSALPPTQLPSTPLPPSGPVGGSGTAEPKLRYRIVHWMENHLGRAAMPVAAIGGGIVGGTLGALTLGPIGGIVGGAAGAFFGAALYLSD